MGYKHIPDYNPMAQRKKATSSRNGKLKKPMIKKTSDRKAIFIIGLISMLIVVSLHASGLIDRINSKYLKNNYVYHEKYGIKMPLSYQIHGIDISAHQGKIDWKKVNETNVEDIRIDFAFIKACEGRTRVDTRFKYNWEQAGKYNFIKGAYHYFLPNKSGEDQAKLFLKTVKLQEGDLVPVCDIEITGGANRETIKKNLSEYLDILEERFDKKPIIYTGKKFFEKYLKDDFEDYPLWIAHYNVPELSIDDWSIWQHSESGTLPGCKRKVDFNVFRGNMDHLDKLRI